MTRERTIFGGVAALLVAVILAAVVISTSGGGTHSSPPAPTEGSGQPALASAPKIPAEPKAPPAPRHHHPTQPISSLRTPPANGPAFAAIKVLAGGGIPIRSEPGGSLVTT